MSNVKLLSKTAITKMQDSIFKTGKDLNAKVHECAVQCMLHAQKHGDTTLMERLVKGLQENLPGYVVAGLVKWSKDNSPVVVETDTKGHVTGSHMAKEGDRGYKPFVEDMTTLEPFYNGKELMARANRPIEPFSWKLALGRIKGLKTQLAKAQEQGGRGVIGDPKQLETALDAIIATAEKIVPFETKEAPKSRKGKGNSDPGSEAKAA